MVLMSANIKQSGCQASISQSGYAFDNLSLIFIDDDLHFSQIMLTHTHTLSVG
jgi:hypothetical protein